MFTGYIDLHVHTDYSDGKRSVEYVANKVIENNIGVIALAEHYNMSSYRALKSAVSKSVEVIPAIELSASLLAFGLSKKHVCHIVAYYPSSKIYSILDEYELARAKCVKKTLSLLKSNGIDLGYNTVLKFARDQNSVGRFDIAIALANLGYAATPAIAYRKFFDLNSPIYIDREKLDVRVLIKQLLLCSGLPVLVHPKSLRLNETDLMFFIKMLKDVGLVGIEAYNSHNTQEQTNLYLRCCDELNLLPTVGSDYHGRSKEYIEIGHGINNNLNITDYSIITNLQKKKYDLFLRGF